jgi:membrane-bound lytic murein transglycosylase B
VPEAPVETTVPELGDDVPAPDAGTRPIPRPPLDLVPVGPLVDGRDRRNHVLGPSDVLTGLPLGSDGEGIVATARAQAEAELAARTSRLAELDRRRGELEARRAELDLRRANLIAARATDEQRTESVRHDLRSIAVARYTSDGPTLAGLDAVMGRDEEDDDRVTSTLAAGAIATSADRLVALHRHIDATTRELSGVDEELEASARALEELAAQRPELQRAIAEQTSRVAAAGTMGSARGVSSVAGSDMTLVALDAYYRAARAMTLMDPDCRLDWWGLAGVGRSESHHGRFKGGFPAIDGTVTVPVVGIALDGTHGTRLIRDTDKGLLDGDTVYDRAVGPMQFIPGTWRRWGADGNGDGRVDPQNLYDMALAAARLLCSGGGRLDTDEGLLAAYLRYNRDPVYQRTVLGWARAYQLLPVPSVLTPPAALPGP